MQHQPDLVDLGLARLKLFQAFTLPSLEFQQSWNFLWTIKTDPSLVPELRQAMHNTLSRSRLYNRIVLLGDNVNPGCFRHSAALDNNKNETVLFGDGRLYDDYVTKAKSGLYVVVETTLDADDALPHDFVDTVQRQVRQRVHGGKDWMYWCTTHHVEWQAAHPHRSEVAGAKSLALRRLFFASRKKKKVPNEYQLDSPYGYLDTLNATKCITAGLTVAYGRDASREDLPGNMVHTRIQDMIPYCSSTSTNNNKNFVRTHCLQSMYNNQPGAIRARSPTSTGMSKVAIPVLQEEEKLLKKNKKRNQQLSLLWDGVENSYGMSRYQIKETRAYLIRHTTKIASDNLKGQCTVGHSCKNETQTFLRSLASAVIGKPNKKKTKKTKKNKNKKKNNNNAAQQTQQQQPNSQKKSWTGMTKTTKQDSLLKSMMMNGGNNSNNNNNNNNNNKTRKKTLQQQQR